MSPQLFSVRFLQTQPDARLASLAAAGHERAFEVLVRRYRRQLLSYCRRLVGSEAAAEDVLQQAFLQAWVSLARGTEVIDARPWLYRIVHNAAISSMRRAGEGASSLPDPVVVGDIDDDLQHRIEARAALAGLAALPEMQRQVMVATALDGRSHEETALALGLSSGAVRGLIYRARSTLRAAAAAITPAPLVTWAARSGTSSGWSETLAGGGSAGAGAVLLKGGAMIAGLGALATAGFTVGHLAPRLHIGHAGARPVAVAPSHGQRSDGATSIGAVAEAQGAHGAGNAVAGASVSSGQPVGLWSAGAQGTQTAAGAAGHGRMQAGNGGSSGAGGSGGRVGGAGSGGSGQSGANGSDGGGGHTGGSDHGHGGGSDGGRSGVGHGGVGNSGSGDGGSGGGGGDGGGDGGHGGGGDGSQQSTSAPGGSSAVTASESDGSDGGSGTAPTTSPLSATTPASAGTTTPNNGTTTPSDGTTTPSAGSAPAAAGAGTTTTSGSGASTPATPPATGGD